MKRKALFTMLVSVISLSLCYPSMKTYASELEPIESEITAVELLEDEILVIPAAETSETAETPAQINAVFDIPEGFQLSAMLQVMCMDAGTVYEINASQENGYMDACFVPLGAYRIISYGIQSDVTNQYPMTLLSEDEFTFTNEKKYQDVRIQLNEFHAVAEEIAEKINESEVQTPLYEMPKEASGADTNKPMQKTYASFFEDIAYGANDIPYFTVRPSKDIDVTCYGYSKKDYELHMEVIEGGFFEEAMIKVYINGNPDGYDYVSKTFNLVNLGLIVYFNVPDDYVFSVGDYFDISTKKFEQFVVSSSNDKAANMLAILDPETITEDFNLKISTISSGGRGVAKLSVVKDDDTRNRTILTIGDDGVVTYEGFTFYFSDAEFAKDMTWRLDYKCENTKPDYTILYFLIGVAGLCGIVAFTWLFSKREKDTDYQINQWKDRHDSSYYE